MPRPTLGPREPAAPPEAAGGAVSGPRELPTAPAEEESEKRAAEDRERVRALLAGDPGARAWVEGELARVPRLAGWLNGRMGRPLGEAELLDLSQDAVLVIWRKLPGFEGRSPLAAWAFQVVRFEFLNAVRRRRRARPRVAGEGPEALEQIAAPADESLAEDEKEGLLAALQHLEDEKRQVIELKHFQALTFRQVGERLGIPENTARTRYYRGLRRLKALLDVEPTAADSSPSGGSPERAGEENHGNHTGLGPRPLDPGGSRANWRDASAENDGGDAGSR